jgi:UDP-MurNAc hydroxylase
LYVKLIDGCYAKFSMYDEHLEFTNDIKSEKHLVFKVDPRLLTKILSGPRYAHWNNAEIGCHIMFYRQPDIYDRNAHYCMNYFHC